jgi:hypothetical protein
MNKIFLLGFVLLLAGCGGTYKVSVYGKTGTAFTAPSLCAALVQCLNSSEVSCFYDKTLLTTATGTEETGCKEVKK